MIFSLDVYLHTCYRPDCDWLEGEVKERNTGEGQHSVVHGFFIYYFATREEAWDIRVFPSLRMRVSETRIRVADVAVLLRSAPYEEIPTVAPLLCIEVMSSEQRMSEIEERAQDYLAMGVPMVWMVDPLRRTAFVLDASGQRQVMETLEVPGTEIRVTLAHVFAELDELEGITGARVEPV